MLWHRVVSALIGAPILIAAVWYGGLALIIITVVLILLGILEMCLIFSKQNIYIPRILVVLGCLFLSSAAYLSEDGYPADALVMIFIVYLITMLIGYPHFTPLGTAAAFFSTVYVSMLLFVFFISTFANGWIWLVIMLFCTWANDTAAYFTGRRFGRHRLASQLSPNKTWEGAAGGIVASVLIASGAALYFQLPFTAVLLAGLLVAAAAQTGDLAESAAKRQAGIKDAGHLIPGHGGVLDRFDSMLFSAPVMYYYVCMIT